MSLPWIFVYIGGFVAFVVAFGMGANNVSNSIGTVVGSGALTVRNGLILAGIFEFLGTVLMGQMVTNTLKTSIISPIHFAGELELFALGMFSCMLTALFWLLIATHYALPISATQTIIGGIVGFAILENQSHNLNYPILIVIVISWFLSPFVGALFGYGLYYSVYKLCIEKGEASKFVISIYYGSTFSILTGFILEANIKTYDYSLNFVIIVTILIFLSTSIITYATHNSYTLYTLPYFIRPLEVVEKKEKVSPENPCPKTPQEKRTSNDTLEQPFKFLMIVSGAFVAFAHGSNDVSNAAGPYAALFEFLSYGTIYLKGGEKVGLHSPTLEQVVDHTPVTQDIQSTGVPYYVLVSCGIGIVVGLFVLGYKTLATVGEKITKLTFSKGYSAQVSGAFTILFASALSLPISTTAILIGSIVGVGLVPDGSGTSIDKALLWKIAGGWLLTVLVGLLGTPLCHALLKAIYL